MANVNRYKIRAWSFFANSHRLRYIHIWKFATWKCRRRLWHTIFAMAPFDGKCRPRLWHTIFAMAPFDGKCRPRLWHTIFAMAPFDGKYQTSYLTAIVMFALSLTVYEIFANLIKCENFYLENEGQGEGREKGNLCHSTGNARFHIGDFFIIVATWKHTFTQTGNTHFHAHINGRGVWRRAKCAILCRFA